MKNEVPPMLFPPAPDAPPPGASTGEATSCSSCPSPKPRASQVQPHHAGAQPQARKPEAHDSRDEIGSLASLLTVDEFASQLRVTRACVRKWILERRIAIVKVGRLVRLPATELRRVIEEGARPRAGGGEK